MPKLSMVCQQSDHSRSNESQSSLSGSVVSLFFFFSFKTKTFDHVILESLNFFFSCQCVLILSGVITVHLPILGDKTINTGLHWLNGTVKVCASLGFLKVTVTVYLDGKEVWSGSFGIPGRDMVHEA